MEIDRVFLLFGADTKSDKNLYTKKLSLLFSFTICENLGESENEKNKSRAKEFTTLKNTSTKSLFTQID